MVEHVVIGDATLYLGDMREILPSLPAVDAIVTDPPYGIADIWVKGGQQHGWQNANIQMGARNSWDNEPPSIADLSLLQKQSKHQIIWGGNYFPLPPARCWLIWNKPERNFSLAEAELAWTNLDKVIRTFDGARSDTGREHPTQKLLVLMEWCLTMLPTDTQSICDPYMGSGTTGVAALKARKKFIGIEQHKPYFDIACRRIEEASKQDSLF